MTASPPIEGSGIIAINAVAEARLPSRSPFRRFIRQQPAGTISLTIIVIWCTVAVFAPFVAPHSQLEFAGDPFVAPGAKFFFGTDQFGRDVFSRVIWGGRISLFVGVIGALSGVTAGATLGICAAYVGGIFDAALVRAVDGLQSIPALVFALVIIGSFGASLTNVLLAVTIIYIPVNARVSRVVARSIGARPFIEAARACGASPARILLAHIVPNVVPSMLVMFSLAVGGAIVVEATLSFLGVGIPPNIASWGSMVQATGIQTLASSWWILLAPSVAMATSVYAFNLLGDALRDQLDPRLRV